MTTQTQVPQPRQTARAGRENTVTADLQIFIPAISPHGRVVQRLPMSVRLIFKNIYGDDMTADKTKYGTTKLRYLDGADSNEIKQAIIDNGSVTASYATSNKCFNNAGTTYFMPQSYDGDYVGHTISIVGWNDNLSRYRFSNGTGVLPQNNGAWLVRNSWGDNNTMGGYFWLSYEDKYIFGEKYSPNFTIDEVTEITDDMTLLQDERYGATYSFNYVDSNDITFINCFDFGENSRTLDKVLFETKSNGADYEIYYIPVRDGVPSMMRANGSLLHRARLHTAVISLLMQTDLLHRSEEVQSV